MANNLIQFTPNNTGFVGVDISTQLALIQQIFRTALGVTSNPNPSSPTGQLQQELAIVLQNINAAFANILNSINPYSAQGVFLDDICANLNIFRGIGTQAQAILNLTGTARTTIPIYSQFQNTSGDIFYSQSAVTLTGSNDSVQVLAQKYGSQVDVSAGAISIIVNKIDGLNSVTNSAVGTLGSDPQNDVQLLNRFLQSRGAGSTGAVASLYASLASISGLQFYLFENNTSAPITIPLLTPTVRVPANSMWIVTNQSVTAPNAMIIAAAIYNGLSAGCNTYSSLATSVNYTIPLTSQVITISWDVATKVYLYIQVELPLSEINNTNIQNFYNSIMQNYQMNGLLLGTQIYASDFLGILKQYNPSIINVTSLQITFTTTQAKPSVYYDTISLPPLQYLSLSSTDFTVNNISFVVPTANVVTK